MGRLKINILTMLTGAFLLALVSLSFSVPVSAEETAVAPLPPVQQDDQVQQDDDEGITGFDDLFPQELGEADVQRYEEIFDLQEKGQWQAADKLIKQLNNPILMGHIMAQRYLHPTKYRSRYKELKGWLAKYADHPQAQQIYKLAMRRKPKNWLRPKAPVQTNSLKANFKSTATGKTSVAPAIPRKRLTSAQRKRVRVLQRQIRYRLRKGWTKSVKNILASKEVKRLFSSVEYDQARAQLGRAYFAAGRDEWALKWVDPAAERSGKYLPSAHWTAGLAAWRSGDIEKATHHFEQVAARDYLSSWMTAAANFWTARGYLVTRQPQKVIPHLEKAADYPRTFYGMMARRLLGLDAGFEWNAPDLKSDVVDDLRTSDHGRRAIALVQLGRDLEAERELKLLAGRAHPEMASGILALASRAKMASLAVRLDDILSTVGEGHDTAAYPIPAWEPKEGFSVDRALVYALIRQESRFNPKAKSYAGARGLMQLMPGTASFVAQDRRYRRSKRKHLFKPELNLDLGQKYIQILLEDNQIKGSLPLMAAAWNAGPGNLQKWHRDWRKKKTTNAVKDPLMFIESIPLTETRNFVKHVMSNLWVYRNRLGQDAPSLTAIAAGNWPVYTALDKNTYRVAATFK